MVHCMAHWGTLTGGRGFVGVPFWWRICTNVHIQFTNPLLFLPLPFHSLPPSFLPLSFPFPPPPPSLPPFILSPLLFLLCSEDGPQPDLYEAPPETPSVILSPSGPTPPPVPYRGDRPPQLPKPRPRSITDDRPPIPTPPNSGPSSSGSHNLGPSLSPPPLPPGTIERTPSPPTTRRWRQSTSFPHEKVADKQQNFGPRSKSPRVSRFCSILESINKCVLKVHVHVYFTHFLLKFSSFLYHSLSLLILSCPPTYTPPISQLYLPSQPFFSFLHLISSHLPSLSSLLIPFPSSHPLSPQAAPPPDEKPHKRMGLWFVEVDR